MHKEYIRLADNIKFQSYHYEAEKLTTFDNIPAWLKLACVMGMFLLHDSEKKQFVIEADEERNIPRCIVSPGDTVLINAEIESFISVSPEVLALEYKEVA